MSLHRLESFTGGQVTAEHILKNINHPRNAIHLQTDTHLYFDGLYSGIEATTGDARGEVKGLMVRRLFEV